MTLDDIKARCEEVGDCWIWQGAFDKGRYPKLAAPDHSHGGAITTQHGTRAVWHVVTGLPIPAGHRVFSTCGSRGCLNPDHMQCGPTSTWGEFMASTGRLKGQPAVKAASRREGRRRTRFTEETYREVMTSEETGKAIAHRLGLSPQTVSKARTGKIKCFQPVGSPFSMLGAR